MGLDMYLTKHIDVYGRFAHRNVSGDVTLTIGDGALKIEPGEIDEVVISIGYWRKANAIHKWFVDNVQDGVDECQLSYVEVEELRQLLALVEQVLEDPSKAKTLLPTSSGFFFGSTEYDQYYTEDLKLTKRILTKALADSRPGSFYYQSSW